MVKAATGSAISVTCPNGKPGEQKGGLFFCTQLDIPNPVVAYIDGKECGRVSFTRATFEARGPSKITCKILPSHTRLTVGQTSEINIETSTGDQEVTLTYNCGSETKTQKRSGLVTDGDTCRFDTPGTIEIEAKADGVVCATKLIEVFEKPKECFTISERFTYSKEDGENVYKAQVAARGYSGSDQMTYSCLDVPHAVQLSTINNPTDFTTTIECRSKTATLSEPVKVKVGGDICGEILPPQ